MKATLDYILHLADNALILGQRNAEWCGHGPVLEQDIAISNISLDLIGQARSFYQYAAELKGSGTTEDDLAYLRDERQFRNILLVEQPKGDWAFTTLRQFLFSSYQQLLFQKLTTHTDERVAAIAEKTLKEVNYHVRWSSEWVIRLGDGTEESRSRILNALASIWTFTGEMFMPESFETTSGIVVAELETSWKEKIKTSFAEANIDVPENTFMRSGGKKGIHSEHLGFILAEMQYLQRSYPGCEW
ncbi:MAG: phenylacetate-CoA oxygenase subunit PaaC [Bacteroidota bacterium]|jgi:ring-1,2-phenylacetyl-CoA epoxidase subunit PaaC